LGQNCGRFGTDLGQNLVAFWAPFLPLFWAVGVRGFACIWTFPVIGVLVGTRFRTSFGPYFLVHFCMSLVHPVSARSSPRFLSWPSTSRWRAHQVDDSLRGPKAAYDPGDEAPLAGPITDRLGYRELMKSPEVWAREVQCDRCGTRPAGEWIDNCWIRMTKDRPQMHVQLAPTTAGFMAKGLSGLWSSSGGSSSQLGW
jgi:hypothetical protein